MNQLSTEAQIQPRPVKKLPDYAVARARRSAAEKLVERFGLSDETAQCIADAVVDPAELRVAIEHPTMLAVPGGEISALRVDVWARRALPDPRNPRIGPARRHPFAVEPGTDEESRFRPVPDPTTDSGGSLEVKVESREHLTWASDLAKNHVLATNDWRYSIRNQGVLTEVWLAPTRYRHGDAIPDLWTLTTAEGSSRLTAVHDILGVRSVDEAYDTSDRNLRSVITRLNEAADRGPTIADQEALRCERIPGLVLVGFEAFPGADDRFSVAVRSLVALRHVDAPREWGEGPEMEALADAVLEELERDQLLTPMKRAWLAGSLTKREAEAAHLSADPAIRAAAIVREFTASDAPRREAIRRAVTSQSTRRRITPLLRIQLATALIVRALGGAGENVDRVRRYMRHAFSGGVREGEWDATHRDADSLLDAALAEAATDPEGRGPARLELAARAAYPLIASLRLWADLGSDKGQPDRRTPGEVIDAMLRERKGLRQLHRALVDHADGVAIRLVDEDGKVMMTPDGAQARNVTDTNLRQDFPQDGDVKAPASPETAHEKLQARLAELGNALRAANFARQEVESVLGADGSSLVDVEGVDPKHCTAWQEIVDELGEAIVVWRATARRRQKNSRIRPPSDDDDLMVALADDAELERIDEWEAAEGTTEEQP